MTDKSDTVVVENQDVAPAQEPVDVAQDAAKTEEKSEEAAPIPRKYVTEIVRRERADAYQKGRKEAMAELQAQVPQMDQQPQPAAQQPAMAPQQMTGLGGMPNVSQEQIGKMIADAFEKGEKKRQEEALQKQYADNAYQMAQKFNASMANGKSKYPDFDEKVKDLDYQGMAPVVHLATETGIPEDVMYDLANNPQKITHLMILAHTQPNLAKREMDRLAASIRANQSAQQAVQEPNSPLSRITPSTTVGKDSGQMSVKDYQRALLNGSL